MDRAIHRDARARVAGRFPAHRSRRHESQARDRCAARTRGERGLAPMARVRGHASLAIPAKGMNMRYYDLYESPQGPILLVASGAGLAGVYFQGQKYFPKDDAQWCRDGKNALLRQAKRELGEYFAGTRKHFEVSLDPSGTPFQKAVWRAISGVAYGETISYGELARRAGAAGRARAAGAATGRNPIATIVPCD